MRPVRSWGINTPSNERWPSGAIDMTYLGPAIKWQHGKVIQMNVTNSLPSNSPTEPGQGQSATCHWHGLNVPSVGDGGPHQAIPNTPGSNTWTATFSPDRPGANAMVPLPCDGLYH